MFRLVVVIEIAVSVDIPFYLALGFSFASSKQLKILVIPLSYHLLILPFLTDIVRSKIENKNAV